MTKIIQCRFLPIVLLFIFYGCNKNKITEGEIQDLGNYTRIDLNPAKNHKLYLSELIRSINIIPLETDSFSLVADINKIDYDDNKYFVWNSYDQLVYVFNAESGSFENRIGSIGQEPGEMVFPGPFSLNYKGKEVWLSSNYKEIYKYDYSGNFIEKFPLKLFYKDFYISPYNGKTYFYTSKKINYSKKEEPICHDLWIMDEKGHFTTYFPYDYEQYPNGGPLFYTRTPFNQLGSNTIFHYVISDTVYHIENNKMSTRYIFDYQNSKTKIELNSSVNVNKFFEDKIKGAGLIFDVIETDDHLIFGYVMEGKEQKAFYSKKSGILKEGEYHNDLFNLGVIFMKSRDNKLIGVMSCEDDFLLTDQGRKFLDNESLDKLSLLTEESNPVIIEFELNDF